MEEGKLYCNVACSRLSVVGDERKRAREKTIVVVLPRFFSRLSLVTNNQEPGTASIINHQSVIFSIIHFAVFRTFLGLNN